MEQGTQWLPVLGICMLRPLGVMLFMPLFNPANLGGSLVRNALVLMIALPVLPLYGEWSALVAADTAWSYILIAAGEIGIGLMIGFCAAIPFWALDMAGYLIDTLRGASMASVLNPLLGQQSSLFGILFAQVFSVLFLVTGGFNELIAAIYHSYATLPPGTVLRYGPGFLAFLSQLWQLMYELCLRFSMPAIVVILLVDMALGLINRSAQQLNVFFLAMPIKSAFALLMLIMCLNFAFGGLLERTAQYARHAKALLEQLR